MTAGRQQNAGGMVDHALALAARGLRVHPLHAPLEAGRCPCGSPNCTSIGKHPRLPDWQRRATSDPNKISQWWHQWSNANIGIATGDGLYVLDVDGEPGRRALAALDLPPTLTARSGRADGGEHLFFAVPEGVELRNASGTTIAHGIDGRGKNGFVVAAGSHHVSGGRYAWTNDVGIAPLPAELIDRLNHRDTEQPIELTPDALTRFKTAAHALPPTERAELEQEAKQRTERVARDLAALPLVEGNGRGDKFYGYARSLGECVGAGVLDLGEATAILENAAGALGLPKSHQAWRSITRGLTHGAARPLEPDVDFGPVRPPTPSVSSPPEATDAPARAIGRSAADLIEQVPEEPDWIVPRVFARGWAVKFAAREKAGKGTFVTNLLGHVERGEATVFGDATAPTTTLIFSEEPQDSMREKVAKGRLSKATIVFGWELAGLLPEPGSRTTPWQLKVDYLVGRAVQDGHEVLFVDNISRAAGVEDEGGVELGRAAEYLFQQCKAAGLSALIDHHHKKGSGKLADKSRGGTALAGATDNNVEIEIEGDWTSRVRRVSSRGRVAATHWQLKIALNDDATDYVLVADGDQPQASKDRHRLRTLAERFPRGATAKDFGEAVELKERAARNALNGFVQQGWAAREDGPPQRWTATGRGLGDDPDAPQTNPDPPI